MAFANRSVDDSSNDSPTLLTLPVTDFDRNSLSDDDTDSERFVLLQLPPLKKGGGGGSLSVSCLMSGTARIIGPSGEDGFSRQSQQACLVLEDKGVSFALSRVETSNALVLVPSAPAESAAKEKRGSGDKVSSPPAVKKLRLSDDECTSVRPTEMRARLLQPGGAGASFLEVRPHHLDRRLLRKMLAASEYDPYNNSGKLSLDVSKRGHSVNELALALRCTEREVRSALISLCAFEMPAPSQKGSIERRYGTLSEEAQMDATLAIVEALNECEEFGEQFSSTKNFDGTVEEKWFVEKVVGRSKDGDAEVLEESVVRHCLRRCAAADSAAGEERHSSVKYLIDVDKIAIFLGHHLFNKQLEPWEEQCFLAEWHKLIPGVDEASRPITALLLHAGVALRESKHVELSSEKGEEVKLNHLVYFPESRLPMEPEARFRKIFSKREKWSGKDLEPYVTSLTEEHGLSMAEMLMKHTRTIAEEGRQWYVAR
mmetsp:Transcript_33002/g.98209  ORF Transcript_33002/g.98209 Transcript_33002/m.98209 type:complete len:485 (-) Transcript_33002:217-1671(-)